MSDFDFSGGALCLDFVNTLAERGRPETEGLHSYGDLVAWAVAGRVLSGSEGRRLERRARREPRAAADELSRAIAIRERLYRIFSALAGGRRPAAPDLAALNADLAAMLPRLHVVAEGSRFTWSWSGRDRLDVIVGPVIESAADLLTSQEAAAVRECASPTCTWMFVDRSRTGRRRWCSMRTCGNRAKARRHYARVRHTHAARST